jgi:hypothetical protein
MKSRILLAALAAALVPYPVFAQVIDGSRTSPGDNYGAPIAVQQVQTQFGDSDTSMGVGGSELDAVYAYNDANNLYLMFTGNIESNFNKFEIFIDSIPNAGENVVTADVQSGGNNPDNDGWADRFALPAQNPGFTFDEGFAADFLMIFRSGVDGDPKADMDFNTVGNDSFVESVFSLFGPNLEGSNGMMPITGIVVGFDNSNNLGVTGGTEAADQAAAAAVETGLELCIPLSAINASLGDTIKVCAFVNGGSHDYVSNQFMAPLQAPQGNLGGDGMGNFNGSVSLVNLNNFPGNQFVEITLTSSAPVTVPAESLTVAPGILNAGGLPELENSDNQFVQIFRNPGGTTAVTQFVITGTSPTATPSALEFTLEGKCVSRPNVVQRIELFNYQTASYEVVDERNANRTPSPDLTVVVTATGDLSRFVDPTSLEMQARVRYRADIPRAGFSSNTDQAIWTVTP